MRRTAWEMTHLKISCVSLCWKVDLKREEVQVHPGIKNRGCLSYTQTSVNIHTQTHPYSHTNTHKLMHTMLKQISHPGTESTHSPSPSSKKQSFPLQLNSGLTIIKSSLSSDFIEFHFTAVFLLFLFSFFWYCCILFHCVSFNAR